MQGLPEDPPYKNLRLWRERLLYSREVVDELNVFLPLEDLPHADSLEGYDMFLFGYFIFEDVFGKRRKTGFCYLLQADAVFHRVHTPAYHYDHEEN